jgi:hypothetical protein
MNRVQIKFIEDAMDNPHHLTEWEQEFVHTLARKPDDYELSEKQNSVLNRISRKLQWD